MNAIQKTICGSLVLASLAGGAPLWAADGERELAREINRANGLLRDGDIDGAIGAYKQAQELGPESTDLSYNSAVAQYRKGDVSAAEYLFQAAAATENDAVAARARYNLGNCDYAAALQLAEKDRPAAINQLESAITNYRSSLDVEPADADARANIELAAKLIDKLREEQKQEEQQKKEQQDQQKQDQEQQSKDQNQQDQQQNNQQNNQQQSKPSQGGEGKDEQSKSDQKSSQDKSQQDQSEQSKKDQAKDEKSQSKKSQDEKSSEEKSKPQPTDKNEAARQDQQPQSNSQANQSRQQQTSQSQEQQKPEDATPQADKPSDKQGQNPPKGKLTTAGEKDANTDENEAQTIAEFDSAKDGEMTAQEAEKMLQAIRDRDMLRRLRRDAAERSQHVPVDRDW